MNLLRYTLSFLLLSALTTVAHAQGYEGKASLLIGKWQVVNILNSEGAQADISYKEQNPPAVLPNLLMIKKKGETTVDNKRAGFSWKISKDSIFFTFHNHEVRKYKIISLNSLEMVLECTVILSDGRSYPVQVYYTKETAPVVK